MIQRGQEEGGVSGPKLELAPVDDSDRIFMTATVEQTSKLATEEEIEAAHQWGRERYPEQYPGDDDPSPMELSFLSETLEIESDGSNDGPQLHRTLRTVLARPSAAVT